MCSGVVYQRWCEGQLCAPHCDTTLLSLSGIRSHKVMHPIPFWGYLYIMSIECKDYITALKALTY